ncbi:hypothetical protein BGZ75_003328 [Mortierella antarctica]|nr:hypothetical protein BGZ75_003328 [Mortierella antarctica]
MKSFATLSAIAVKESSTACYGRVPWSHPMASLATIASTAPSATASSTLAVTALGSYPPQHLTSSPSATAAMPAVIVSVNLP